MGRLEYTLKLWYIYNGDGDMKKNGFTLTEILVVLALIGLLLVIVVPRISNSLNKGTDKAMKVQERELEDAGLMFLEDMCKNPIDKGKCPITIKYNNTTNTYSGYVLLNTLVSEKYIDKIKLDKQACNGCVRYTDNEVKAYIKCGSTYITEGYNNCQS